MVEAYFKNSRNLQDWNCKHHRCYLPKFQKSVGNAACAAEGVFGDSFFPYSDMVMPDGKITRLWLT